MRARAIVCTTLHTARASVSQDGTDAESPATNSHTDYTLLPYSESGITRSIFRRMDAAVVLVRFPFETGRHVIPRSGADSSEPDTHTGYPVFVSQSHRSRRFVRATLENPGG